jgi:hypothetical protein
MLEAAKLRDFGGHDFPDRLADVPVVSWTCLGRKSRKMSAA